MKDIKRIVSTSFWQDDKVVELFSPEDKYFYLYLLTNPHTTQIGIYKLVPKTAAFELGYSVDSVNVLLDRFKSKYDMIRYSEATKEVAIKNYLRHSIVKGGKPVLDCLIREEKQVEDKSLLIYIYQNIKSKNIENLTVREYLKHIDIYINENERIVYDSSEKKKPSVEINEFYESAWKLYPVKKGKGAVSKTQKEKLYRNVGLDQMIRCIERFKKDMEGRDPKYIMHGSTFFNSGYVDYLDENYDHVESHHDYVGEPQRGIDGDLLE